MSRSARTLNQIDFQILFLAQRELTTSCTEEPIGGENCLEQPRETSQVIRVARANGSDLRLACQPAGEPDGERANERVNERVNERALGAK